MARVTEKSQKVKVDPAKPSGPSTDSSLNDLELPSRSSAYQIKNSSKNKLPVGAKKRQVDQKASSAPDTKTNYKYLKKPANPKNWHEAQAEKIRALDQYRMTNAAISWLKEYQANPHDPYHKKFVKDLGGSATLYGGHGNTIKNIFRKHPRLVTPKEIAELKNEASRQMSRAFRLAHKFERPKTDKPIDPLPEVEASVSSNYGQQDRPRLADTQSAKRAEPAKSSTKSKPGGRALDKKAYNEYAQLLKKYKKEGLSGKAYQKFMEFEEKYNPAPGSGSDLGLKNFRKAN